MQSRIQAYLHERSLMIHALHHDMRHGLFKLQMRLEQIDDEALRAKSSRNIEDLLEVLEDILAFADTDIGPDQRQNIRANAMLMNAADPHIDQGRSISMDLTGPHTVFANQTRLKRICGNLVDNAMAYANRLWISSQIEGDHYKIVFDDDGLEYQASNESECFSHLSAWIAAATEIVVGPAWDWQSSNAPSIVTKARSCSMTVPRAVCE